jgi:hypothetical protein
MLNIQTHGTKVGKCAKMGLFFDATSQNRSQRRSVLIVEGKDDGAFFEHLLTALGANPDLVGVIATSGNTKLKANLEALKRSRAFTNGTVENIGVIQDADTDPNSALTSVHGALEATGFPAPNHASFLGSAPRLGLFLLPSAASTGDLEQVCLDTIPADPRTIAAGEFFKTADAQFGPFNHKSKRTAAIFLTLVAEETRGVGNAFSKGVFDIGHSSLTDLKAFLTELIR